MLHKPIADLIEQDFENLINQKRLEDKTLEYKLDFAISSDSEKKEFLADVSSFANASGGDMIFGIQEQNGEPQAIVGVTATNLDELKLRIESLIRDGIDARIPNIQIRSLPTSKGNVVVVRIPSSFLSPHAVTYKNHSKFYSRNSAGKFQLDVDELRSAFLLSDAIHERMKKFRTDRISAIFSDDLPVLIEDKPKVVLHFLPLASFKSVLNLKIEKIAEGQSIQFMRPMSGSGMNFRFNLDGFVTHAFASNSNENYSYAQLFKNGIIEMVDSYILNPRDPQRFMIPSNYLQEKIFRSVSNFLTVGKMLGVPGPFFVFLSLLGVRNYTLAVDTTKFMFPDYYPIDRDNLIFPEAILDNDQVDVLKCLQPVFDSIWNSAGWPKCYYYDEKGNYIYQLSV